MFGDLALLAIAFVILTVIVVVAARSRTPRKATPLWTVEEHAKGENYIVQLECPREDPWVVARIPRLADDFDDQLIEARVRAEDKLRIYNEPRQKLLQRRR